MAWQSRVVDLKLNPHSFREPVRVNIVYEREIGEQEQQDEQIVDPPLTPPPTLDLEGYENEAPWVGEEVVVAECSEEEEILDEQGFEGQETGNEDYYSRQKAESTSSDSQLVIRRNEPWLLPVKRKRKIQKTNVLRFTSVEEFNSYCATNQLDGNVADSRFKKRNTDNVVMKEGDKKYIYSIDDDYGSQVTTSSSASGKLPNGAYASQAECSQQSITECQICNVQVSIQKRKQHIYIMHLRKPLFKCPMCNVAHIYHRGNVEAHIRKIHKSNLAPICLKDRYQSAIDAWLYKCFGDTRLLRFVDPEISSLVFDLVDWTCQNRRFPLPSTSKSSTSSQSVPTHATEKKAVSYDPQQMPDDLLEPDVSEAPPPSSVPVPLYPVAESFHLMQPGPLLTKAKTYVSTCNLCGITNQKHLERHVLQHHLKRAVFLCPFCNYSSKYACNAVKDHIRVKHSYSEYVSPIDLREEYWAEIRKLYDQCFLESVNSRR